MIKQFKKPIIITVVAIIIALLAGCAWLIGSILAEVNSDKNQAADVAREQTDLQHVSKVEPYAGDRAFMVVYGQSEEGEDMIVWLNEEELYVQYAKDGVAEHQIREQVEAADPGNEILNVRLGKIQDLFVWEVFYKQNNEENEQYYYEYYHFANGAKIDTYRMAAP